MTSLETIKNVLGT